MRGGNENLLGELRSIWSNPLLVNRAGRQIEDISIDIDNNIADMAPIAVWALANPDIVERMKKGALLNEPDRTTFFGGGSKGYTDYPTLEGLDSLKYKSLEEKRIYNSRREEIKQWIF